MITEKLYKEGKCIVEEFDQFIIQTLKGKAYKENYYKLNYYKLPLTEVSFKKETLSQANVKILNEFIDRMKASKAFTKLKRTPSKGISIEGAYLHSHPFQYDIVKSTSKIILTVATMEGSYKIAIGWFKAKEEKKEGKTPSRRWIQACEKHNIDLSKYENSFEEGKLAAASIHKPAVGTVTAIRDKIYEGNIHHLDFHKFYPSGIVMLHPEFREAFEELVNNKDKEALDIGTRYLASEYAQYKYAKVIKEGINYMYERFFQLSDELNKSGRKILAYNTDGIWYQGEVYHGIYEGTGLGEWENDYINIQKIRFKSSGLGAYEFIKEDGTYESRYKGQSSYEREIPRDQWVWGDIYKGSDISIALDEIKEHIILKGELK